MKKFFAILVGALVLTACSNASVEDDGSLQVMTTIPPLYSLTAQLVDGVEDVEVTNLVPAGVSVHDFQLTPSDAIALENADLVVVNGIEIEEFLIDVIGGLEADVVNTSEGVTLLEFEEHEEHEEHEEEHDDHDHGHDHDEHEEEEDDHHGHNHGEYDPHIWLDPANAKVQVANIMEALVALDEANAEIYKANYDELSDELDKLYRNTYDVMNVLQEKPYIVFHDAYQYFEAAFGLDSVASVEPFPGEEPSPEYLTELIDLIEDGGVKVVFTEPQFSPKLVKTLAEDYDLTVLELDPLGAEVSLDGYQKMMRGNVDAFITAFE